MVSSLQFFYNKVFFELFTRPSEEFKEDLIVEELQRGYHLEGKVLRHALVKVSMGPGKQNSQEEVEKDKVEEDIDSEENTSEDV